MVVQWSRRVKGDLPLIGMGLGDSFAEIVKTETTDLGYTIDQVRAWPPPAPERGKKGKKAKG